MTRLLEALFYLTLGVTLSTLIAYANIDGGWPAQATFIAAIWLVLGVGIAHMLATRHR